MIIEIIKIPDGIEPEFVRKEWKGLWLEAYEKVNCDLSASPSGTPPGEKPIYGIYVDSTQALSIIKKKSPKAAEWYYSNIPEEKLNSFSFGPFSPDEFREI